MKRYRMTRYPAIYRKTSWGKSLDNSNDGQIYELRNIFITEHAIRDAVSVSRYCGKKNFMNRINEEVEDVVSYREVYVDHDDNLVVLVSPECPDHNGQYDELFEQHGWFNMGSMQDRDTTTYMMKYQRD